MPLVDTSVQLGLKTSPSAPNAFGDHVWFRGDDDLLWKMPVAHPADVVNPQGMKTLSTPTPCIDGYVYFQGEGNKLIMMQQEAPYLHANLGDVACWAPPTAPGDGYVYVRDGAGKLVRVQTRGEAAGTMTRYAVYTAWQVAVHIGTGASPVRYVFFADGRTYKLKRLDLNAQSVAEYGSFKKLLDAPVMGSNGKLYIADESHDAHEVDPTTATTTTKLFGSAKSTPVTSQFGFDGNIYWRAVGDALNKAAVTAPGTATELSTTSATPDPVGDGYVVFLGEDSHIHRVAVTPTGDTTVVVQSVNH